MVAEKKIGALLLGLSGFVLASLGCPAITHADEQIPIMGQSAVGNLTARGLLRATNRIELRTLLTAPIAEMPFREGQRFKSGDLLIGFDCTRYEAEAAAAKAGANAAWIDYKSKKRLLAHAAIGKDEVSLSAARANEASAELRIREAVNADCEIRAPFDGLVVAIRTRRYEYPNGDGPLMIILDDSRIEVELVVPSNWLNWLKPGEPFRFEIEETGKSVAGQIDRLTPEIDPVSQTVRVFGILENGRQSGVLAGMSGISVFSGRVDG